MLIPYKDKADKLIVTLCGGDFHKHFATISHPAILRYAQKCKADFLVIDSNESCDYLTWAKFKLKDYLKQYKRILYIDTDVLIMTQAESLFDIVPETHVGMFNEYPYTKQYVDIFYSEYLKFNDFDESTYFDKKHYYNSGVILFSRGHEQLLTAPRGPRALERERELFGDQNYFNINIIRHNIFVMDIGLSFNAFISQEDKGMLWNIPLAHIKIYHFAGMFDKGMIKTGEAYTVLHNTLDKLKFWGVKYNG